MISKINTTLDRKKVGMGERIKLELVRNKNLYIMAVPVILFYLIFCYGPMVGIVMAFKEYDVAKGIMQSNWVGFKNFIEFFNSMYFQRTMTNTFLMSVYDLIFGFPMPIMFALLLNEIKSKKFKKSVQTITYLPHFISIVVICGMIADFFNTNGIVTKLFALMGGEKVNYIGTAKYFRSIFVGTNIWQGFGWGSIIYLAALAGINLDLYEASVIDGASRFKQLIHITLPGIAGTIVVMLILRIGQLMAVGYEKIILLYSPGTYETADVISSFVYRRGIGEGNQFSFTTAVGLFSSMINLSLLLVANKLAKKFSDTALF